MYSDALMNFKQSLGVLVYGMGGIFIVLTIIFITIKVLIKVFPEKQ